ncbi:MAG: efflux RND transporter periplasmic adaptor subunit [SAR202 cluster bacterium]|nr:efflux RND transporter periplasmic adaptor subunit [SAR202 cluster bacterium]
MKSLAVLQPWQIGVLAAVLIIGFGGMFGVYALLTGEDAADLETDQQLIPVQRGNLVNEVSVNGSVLFPNRETLNFGSQGTVAELFVVEGQRVNQFDALASFDADTIAGLERSVAQARVELRNAQDTLSELSDPSALNFAQTESKIAAATIVLENAVDALAKLTDPTTLDVAQARAKVASSKASLLNAQEKLEALTEPPSGQAVASAEAKIANNQELLQKAEDALTRLIEQPTPLEVAQAEAKITNARIAVERAEEAFDDIKDGATPDELASARLALEIAETQHANAEAELAFNIADWETKLDAAGESAQKATDDYLIEFQKWLGTKLTAEDMNADPNVVLASQGIDLATVFDSAKRGAELSGDSSEIGVPPDDPETAWNETTLFAWLNLSPMPIVATCDGPIAWLGVCVQQELETAGAAYSQSTANLESAQVQSSKALVASESSVEKARETLVSFQEILAEIEGPPDPLIAEDRSRELAVATSTLQVALDDLAALREGASDIDIGSQRAQVALALQNLEQAKSDLADLVAPLDEVLIEDQDQQVELAASTLAKAEDDLELLLGGAAGAKLEAARLNVEVARLNLEDLKADLALTRLGPDRLDLALQQADVASAVATLEQAEQWLIDATIIAPWDGFVSAINVELGQSVNANSPVMEIVDTSVVEVDGIVDEIDVLFVQLGSTALVTMDALPGQFLPGNVSYIATEARTQQGVVSYPVRIRVTPPEGFELPEGLSAVASVVIREDRNVLMVPIQSLYGSFDEPSVKVMSDGNVVDRQVVLGNSDDFWTVVLDGLIEGDTVIMESQETQNDRFQFGGGDFRRIQAGFVAPGGGFGGGGRGGR